MRETKCWAVYPTIAGWQGENCAHIVAAVDSKRAALAWITNNSSVVSQFGLANVPRAVAVKAIRTKVYARDEGRCVQCGERVTFQQMHMHERQSRGKGGIVSIENCETRCHDCHLGPRALRAHGGRRPRFGESANRLAYRQIVKALGLSEN